jgi:hypothetical protein
MLALAAYAAATIPFYGPGNAISVAAAGAVLIWANRVRLPKPIASLALTLSGASLFIYLFHFVFGSATRSILGPHPSLEVLAALVGGVAVSRAWLWGAPLVGRRLREIWRSLRGSSATTPAGAV